MSGESASSLCRLKEEAALREGRLAAGVGPQRSCGKPHLSGSILLVSLPADGAGRPLQPVQGQGGRERTGPGRR